MRKTSIILIAILIISPLFTATLSHNENENKIQNAPTSQSKNYQIQEIKPFQVTTITLDFYHRSEVYKINVDKPGFLTITVRGKSISEEYLKVSVNILTNADFISFLEGKRVSKNITISMFNLYFPGREYESDSFSIYVGKASTFYLILNLFDIDNEDSLVNLEVEYRLTPTTDSSPATLVEGNQLIGTLLGETSKVYEFSVTKTTLVGFVINQQSDVIYHNIIKARIYLVMEGLNPAREAVNVYINDVFVKRISENKTEFLIPTNLINTSDWNLITIEYVNEGGGDGLHVRYGYIYFTFDDGYITSEYLSFWDWINDFYPTSYESFYVWPHITYARVTYQIANSDNFNTIWSDTRYGSSSTHFSLLLTPGKYYLYLVNLEKVNANYNVTISFVSEAHQVNIGSPTSFVLSKDSYSSILLFGDFNPNKKYKIQFKITSGYDWEVYLYTISSYTYYGMFYQETYFYEVGVASVSDYGEIWSSINDFIVLKSDINYFKPESPIISQTNEVIGYTFNVYKTTVYNSTKPISRDVDFNYVGLDHVYFVLSGHLLSEISTDTVTVSILITESGDIPVIDTTGQDFPISKTINSFNFDSEELVIYKLRLNGPQFYEINVTITGSIDKDYTYITFAPYNMSEMILYYPLFVGVRKALIGVPYNNDFLLVINGKGEGSITVNIYEKGLSPAVNIGTYKAFNTKWVTIFPFVLDVKKDHIYKVQLKIKGTHYGYGIIAFGYKDFIMYPFYEYSMLIAYFFYEMPYVVYPEYYYMLYQDSYTLSLKLTAKITGKILLMLYIEEFAGISIDFIFEDITPTKTQLLGLNTDMVIGMTIGTVIGAVVALGISRFLGRK